MGTRQKPCVHSFFGIIRQDKHDIKTNTVRHDYREADKIITLFLIKLLHDQKPSGRRSLRYLPAGSHFAKVQTSNNLLCPHIE